MKTIRMKHLVIVFLLGAVSAFGQYQKVDSWTSPDGVVISPGDTFVMGEASGQNDQYLYVHSKPGGLKQVVYLRAGFDGREFTVKEVRVDKNNPKMGYLFFKYGLSTFMVQANKALEKGEIIANSH